jgi:hypothetical protein
MAGFAVSINGRIWVSTEGCDRTAANTRVLLTVVPRTTDPADYLRALSLRFCGEVLDAQGPTGWSVDIKREKGRSAVAADVTWELPDAGRPFQVAASGRIAGFEVTLRGKWRRGLDFYAAFTRSAGLARASPHDCPYPFR